MKTPFETWLDKEVEDFTKKRTPPSVPDVVGFRHYMGIALTGLLKRGLNTAPEEALDKAAELAVLALKKEQDYRGS